MPIAVETAIAPVLTVRDAAGAVDFYKREGATEIFRSKISRTDYGRDASRIPTATTGLIGRPL